MYGTSTHKLNKERASKLALSLMLAGCLLSLNGQIAGAQQAYAQPAYAQPMQTSSSNFNISSEQESLLPPEVVPLDPATAARMQQAQAQSRTEQTAQGPALASDFGKYDGSLQAQTNNPATSAFGPNGAKSAQEYRKAALEALTGQSNVPVFQQNPLKAAPLQTAHLGNLPVMSTSAEDTELSQSPLINPNQNPTTLATVPMQQGQVQTLTGAPKTQPVRRDIKRAGFSHAFSAMTGFGSGLFMGSVLRNPSNLMGIGMMGAAMTGFGSRNGFRF
jgi:hypothetical protein